MSDSTLAVAYLRNQGWHQIARNERFSHRHMSVVREEGNDTSSRLPSRLSECVNGPSVPEGSNPQDRVEPKPDHSRQDFSCLGQTICGSVRPREEHEIGIIRLTHSGGGVLESFLHRAPCATQGSAKMGSHVSSEVSYEASLEPMNMANLADMTKKLAFLLTLASAKREQ